VDTALGLTIVKEFEWSKIPFLFTFILLGATLLGRTIVIGIPVAWHKIRCEEPELKLKEYTIIWYSGLIRGAIAFALVFQVSSNPPDAIKLPTIIIVVLTTLPLSFLMQSFSGYVGLRTKEEEDQYVLVRYQMIIMH
jgi:NhaP-type Na+/H+ or K+/H+ antiporter